jgi:hypothetical protein
MGSPCIGPGSAEERILSLAICLLSRSKKASMLKILFWDGNGLCLFSSARSSQSRLSGRSDGRVTDGSIHVDTGTTCDADRRHRLARPGARLEAGLSQAGSQKGASNIAKALLQISAFE